MKTPVYLWYVADLAFIIAACFGLVIEGVFNRHTPFLFWISRKERMNLRILRLIIEQDRECSYHDRDVNNNGPYVEVQTTGGTLRFRGLAALRAERIINQGTQARAYADLQEKLIRHVKQ